MSKFTQCSTGLTSLLSSWSSLEEDLKEQIEILQDLEQQEKTGPIDLDVLSHIHEQSSLISSKYETFQQTLQPLKIDITKFHMKAEEGKKNPDVQIYGTNMVIKIGETYESLTKLLSEFEPLGSEFQRLQSYLEELLKNATIRHQQQEQIRRQAEAEAQARALEAEQERARVAAEAAKVEAARLAAEAAAAAEARARAAVEEARLAKIAADERAAEERAQREAVLAERRRDAEATQARVDAERRTAEEASKPLLQRSIEGLKAALLEMKNGSTLDEYHVGLQTLLKFLSNIMTNPREEKYRHIRSENEIFQRRLGSRPGGLAALQRIGFEPIVTPATLPAGSELQPNTRYFKIEAKAELWPVLVESKKELEAAMRESGGALPNAAPATAAGAAAPAAAAASPAGADFFRSMFGAGMGAGAAGGAGVAQGGVPNFLSMMNDPFITQLMSSPNMLNQLSSGRMPDRGAVMSELMSNPNLLQSMMSSPMVQQMMASPQLMQQAMAAQQGGMSMGMGAPSPFASMFGAPPAAANPPTAPAAAAGGAPAANPMAAFLNMMNMRGPAPGATAPGAAPFNPFNFFQFPPPQPPAASQTPSTPAATPAPAAQAQTPIATPVTATAAAAASPPAAASDPASTAAADVEMTAEEEAELAEAIAMSMQAESQERKE